MNRNWTEDFGHDNGEYWNICVDCGDGFMGHKRRITCKVCATVNDLTAKLKLAVEALTRLGDCDWVITLPDRMDAVRAIAREAIAKIGEQR